MLVTALALGRPDADDEQRCLVLRALLAKGARVDDQNATGFAALHLAALASKPALVRLRVPKKAGGGGGGARVFLIRPQ